MDNAVAGALIGVGGVVLGVVLTAGIDHVSRRHVSQEQREQARHARELIAAEHLDEALLNASRALAGESRMPDSLYTAAYEAWLEGWAAYSPRIGTSELLNRYSAVGTILREILDSHAAGARGTGRIAASAIGNARATLAHFMRGEEKLPAASFPELDELKRLLGQGDGLDDPMKPLGDWLNAHPEPEFH